MRDEKSFRQHLIRLGAAPSFGAVAAPAFDDVQRDMYALDELAQRWEGLIREPRYTVYPDCEDALGQLLSSPTWQLLILLVPRMILDLGVGLGDKFIRVVSAAARATTSPAFLMLDSSEAMLERAWERVHQTLGAAADELCIKAIAGDFMTSLSDLNTAPMGASEASWLKVIFMLGCTFCNLDETAFLAQLETIVQSGDHLIVGLELASLMDGRRQSDSALLAPYAHDPYQNFWKTYRRLSSTPALAAPNDAAIDVAISADPAKSCVPGARTIETRVVIDGRTKIFPSKRHDEGQLIAFFGAHGYDCVTRVASARNPFYNHLVFARR